MSSTSGEPALLRLLCSIEVRPVRTLAMRLIAFFLEDFINPVVTSCVADLLNLLPKRLFGSFEASFATLASADLYSGGDCSVRASSTSLVCLLKIGKRGFGGTFRICSPNV